MGKIVTKHFQYTGMDDYDTSIDAQINVFLEESGLTSEHLIDIKYSAYAAGGVHTCSALVIYEE